MTTPRHDWADEPLPPATRVWLSEMEVDIAAAYSAAKLGRSKVTLANAPATWKAVFIGDSTSDNTTAAQYLQQRLQNYHGQAGEALDGITAANIIFQGNNGQTLLDYLAATGGTFKYADLVAATPNVVVASWGFNDVRLGQTTLTQLVTRLTQLVNNIRRDLPNTDILLRMPNTMTTTADGTVKESDQTTNASAATVQAYCTLIREAYLQLRGVWANVDVIDIQAEVFGTQAQASHPLMGNQLHPSAATFTQNSVPFGGGYVAIADAVAKRLGLQRGGFPIVDPSAFRAVRDDLFCTTGGSAFLDIAQHLPNGETAAQIPLTTADSLYVSGQAGPISLSAASITRPFGGTNIRIAGLTGKDFTNSVGKRVALGLAHADRTTGDRQVVSANLPSIAAGAFGTLTVTVTGARQGDLHDATGIIAVPPAAFETAGLYLVNAYASANDTVRLVVWNPTGGAIDRPAENWAFWVIR